MVICTEDRPGLFASITGVLTALNFDILNARIFTANDGRILDVFRISHHGRPEVVMAEQKWVKFRSVLDGVLGRQDRCRPLGGIVQAVALLQKRAPKVSTAVNIDNEASDDFTIVEVFTEDRIGVLFTITYSLHRLGLSIHVAKISTNVDQVADVFYVTDNRREGHRAERLEDVRSFYTEVWRRTMKQTKDSLSPSIDSFLSMVAVEKGLAKNTLDAYSRDLAGCPIISSNEVADWSEVDASLIRAFVSSLRATGLSRKSIARHVVTVRRLLRFLQTENSSKTIPCRSCCRRRASANCRRHYRGEMFESCWPSPTPSSRWAPAIRRCWSCCTPPACGCRSWFDCRPTRSIFKAII